MKNRMSSSEEGFSLIELAVTVAVIGIIATIVIPNMIGWRGDRQLQGFARNYAADIQLARLTAIRDAENVVVDVDEGADTYQIFIDTNKNQSLDGGEEVLRNVNCPTGISIDYVGAPKPLPVPVPPPFNLISLTSRGYSSSEGFLAEFKNNSGDLKSVSVTILGSVRIEDY